MQDQAGLKAAITAGEGRANVQEEEMDFKGVLKRISHQLSETGKGKLLPQPEQSR